MQAPTLPTPDTDWLAALSREALHDAARARCAAAWRLACEVFPGLPQPAVWLDLRGKCAGQAHFGRGGLRLNPVLLAENRLAFFVEVIPHEMAHWLVHHLEGGERVRPHGHEWRSVMRRLYGLEPSATHRFDTRRASPAPHRYRCACRDHHFSQRRHARALGGQRYYCRHCRQQLRHADSATS
ncbi:MULTISPECIES: SprT-like domain-containing protein [unclassified Modicisalibacter]|uniref:SprT family zinc-dependent metalloprotease n=1 Tax=unclassified Modicisalibacter TaxID=2679913 RepID=UPI001CC9A7DF|nr:MULTISPECIES: SprT-like domain-containing protein [unclassified Modicisalibacter]MBZ9559260.1 SprT-like domain-containing protein [Modicisalibacter sp. R2A 31.J]MBZ9576575.1 SprT-like domain-containing protein [Modicisalibacter sp. MOD 31.J]